MRVGVIRNDLSAPILAADLEQVSRRNTSVDAPGQVQYLSYPTVANVEAALADPDSGAGATIVGSDISGDFPLTIDGTNDTLRLKTTSAGAFVVYSIPQAAYADLDELIDALNGEFDTSVLRAFNWGPSFLAIESKTYGVDSYLELDTTANGSTANTALGFPNGVVRTMPSAADFIAGVGLPGGPLDLSQATVEAIGAGTNTRALEPYYDDDREIGVLNAFAQIFAETDVAVESCLVGVLSGFASATFNPDSRNSSVSAGAAVTILDDDGTAFSQTVPTITAAAYNNPAANDLTITGTGLGGESGNSTDPLRSTKIHLYGGGTSYRVHQEQIEAAGGRVTATEIFIPAGSGLIPASTSGLQVLVQFRQLVTDPESVTT